MLMSIYGEDELKIHYSACVHCNEVTRCSEQQYGSLTCCYFSLKNLYSGVDEDF